MPNKFQFNKNCILFFVKWELNRNCEENLKLLNCKVSAVNRWQDLLYRRAVNDFIINLFNCGVLKTTNYEQTAARISFILHRFRNKIKIIQNKYRIS